MKIEEKINEYLDDISYTLTTVDELTPDRLYSLENKDGFVVENKKGLPFYIHRKIEPVKFLNQIIIMEKTEEFTVVDAFGVLPYDDNAENIIEYVHGLME